MHVLHLSACRVDMRRHPSSATSYKNSRKSSVGRLFSGDSPRVDTKFHCHVGKIPPMSSAESAAKLSCLVGTSVHHDAKYAIKRTPRMAKHLSELPMRHARDHAGGSIPAALTAVGRPATTLKNVLHATSRARSVANIHTAARGTPILVLHVPNNVLGRASTIPSVVRCLALFHVI